VAPFTVREVRTARRSTPCSVISTSPVSAARRALEDHDDTEELSYVDGAAANPPFLAWALTDDALDSVATLLRDYHRHVASFDGARLT
jgi:hypothetical protein